MEKDEQIKIMKKALKEIANLYGNPYNSQEAVIIARESIMIAKKVLKDIEY